MCSIFCSNNVSKFEVLCEGNLPRGNFATGILCLHGGNNQMVLKKQGTLNFDEVKLDDLCDYYVGHLQAPTSAKRTWSYDTSHPFESLSWSVVHNGVLTNWQEVRAKHIDWDVSPVDTSIIPNLLQHFTEECREVCPGHVIIKKVLGIIEGTFALCMVDTDCNEVYIARQGSVIHYNDYGDVSTLGGEGFKLLPEGIIMILKNFKSWEVVDTFETKSPFLFI